MRILEKEITKNELFAEAEVVFGGEMVKGVVDIKRELVAVDAELHADLERLLLENGSEQENLWGVNFWNSDEDFVEFDSMINIRPSQNNRSRYVENAETREKIIAVVKKWIR
ncbi:MAG: DUF5674 family protein [Candidatus Saccharibacteria bacterium]|nr:DUF5674 family protein [Candidatus Saccharibacteria bacterium]